MQQVIHITDKDYPEPIDIRVRIVYGRFAGPKPQPQNLPKRIMYRPPMAWTDELSLGSAAALQRAGFRDRSELTNLADCWQTCGLSPDQYREVCEWLLC